ncbi:MAG TPA: hypothetical protein PLW32_08350 [Chitinophagaceae bacterium]|nr:DUF2142 domain-containing protein [Chitinophagaceae bacterium]MBP9739502.1 DUF2142 domain-containing protein [Chitinophagaceae bacterium]HPH23877.1 hypothetical protein [Chitinophagaceae bacterium]
MQYFIFIAYFIFFSWLITTIPFIKNAGIQKKWLIALFALKVTGGLAYAFFYQLPAYHANSDTYRFFKYSLAETDILLQHPLKFIQDLFSSGYHNSGNIFIAEDSYWNDLKSNIIIKLLAICNVFTGKNYFTNIIFFNFLFFFGLIALYRTFEEFFKERKWLPIIIIFCIPSTLFWCSGIHKDGLLLSASGLLFWYFNTCINKGFNYKRILAILVLLIALFTLRNYVFFALVVAFFACWLATKFSKKRMAFMLVYVIGIVLFFVAPQIHEKLNFPNYIVTKQEEFKQLNGGSLVQTKNLEDTFNSFVQYLPQAIDMSFFQPHIYPLTNKSYLPAIAENIFILLLIVVAAISIKKTNKFNVLFATNIAFALTILLIIGYTITFSGAVVRYKSSILPFLLIPIVYHLSRKKQFINKK